MSKNVNKLQSEVLLNLFKENDVVLLTETWLGDEAYVQVNGYRPFQLNRTVKNTMQKGNQGV